MISNRETAGSADSSGDAKTGPTPDIPLTSTTTKTKKTTKSEGPIRAPSTSKEVAVIPDRIITRPPSAELRPDQKDQDSLPPYEVLDGILGRYMEGDQGIDQIVAAGYALADVERVTRLIKINEYKRRQSPVGIRITHRAFGRDWRYPITSKFRA